MGIGGQMILGGLLQGVGKGISDEMDARREAALAAAKEQADELRQERQNTFTASESEKTRQNARDMNDADNAALGARVDAAGQQRMDEIRLQADTSLSKEKQIAALKHSYDMTEIQAKGIVDLNHDLKIANITPDHYEVGANGQIVIWKKDGTALVRGKQGDFVPKGSKDDDGGASIEDARASRGGDKPAEATAASSSGGADAGMKAKALANLGNVYAKIASDPAQAAEYRKQYPGMFDANGNLLSKEELIQRVNQRYGS